MLKSNVADISLDSGSLYQYCTKYAAQYTTITAMVDEKGTKVSFGKLMTKINKCAVALHQHGVAQGTVCLIQSPNTVEYVVAFLAILRLGGVVTTMNPAYTAREITHQLQDSKAQFVFTSAEQLGTIREVDSGGMTFKHVFVWDMEMVGDQAPLHEKETAFYVMLAQVQSGVEAPVYECKGDELAVLPYSSGTTGLSKGVMLSHNNIIANLGQVNGGGLTYKQGDRILTALPMYHIYGLTIIMLHAIRTGSTMVIMRKFDFAKFLSLVQEHRVQWVPIVPPIMVALSKHPEVDKFDLTSVHTILCGAAPLGGELAQSVKDRLPNIDIRQGYGMTELSPVTHLSPPNNLKYAAAGTMVPNTIAKLVDPATGEVVTTTGTRGELWIKGPQVMIGYLNNEEATSNTIDKDGFLHTGDVCEFDDEGYFTVVDRIKELIKYKGFQVPPAELEGLILQHEHVADCAVVPVPDDAAGELPKAYVVRKPNTTLSEEDVKEFVKAKVVWYKNLRGGVEFVESIPKSASGKILRRILKDKEAQKIAKAKGAKQGGDQAPKASPPVAAVPVEPPSGVLALAALAAALVAAVYVARKVL